MSSPADRLIEMSFGQAFLLGLALAAGYYFVAYDSGESKINQAQEAQRRTGELNQELITTQKELDRSKEFKETLKLKDEQFLTFTSYIPEQLNISDMMKSISAEAKAAGVNILSIKESNTITKNYQYTDPLAIEVTLEGGFPQHILFLSYLTRLDSIFTVNSMAFSGSTAGAQKNSDPTSISVRFSATIVGYRYTAQGEATNAPEVKR